VNASLGCSPLATRRARSSSAGTRKRWSARSTTTPTSKLADAWVGEIVREFADWEMPLEVRRLGRMIKRWRDQIIAWHRPHVSNGPTEAVNNLVKRVKQVAFGMRRFRNYRIRAPLYAGRPNWDPTRPAPPTMRSEEPVYQAALAPALGQQAGYDTDFRPCPQTGLAEPRGRRLFTCGESAQS
jgi:Transposase